MALRLREITVDQHDGHRSLADGGGDPFRGLRPYVARDEHTRHAGFQVVRRPVQYPAAGVAQIGAGQDEAVVVAGEYSVKPLGARCGPDEDEHPAAADFLGLAGLVGVGRTGLARVLFGILPADSGTITLAGRDVRIDSPRDAIEAGIGYVPEDRRRHGVILPMSIAANITMATHAHVFPHAWLQLPAERSEAQRWIQDLAIKTPSEEVPAANLSGGNQQKVALARWLAADPKVLILDEPTQGVDVAAKAEIHKLIRRLAARGLAVLMVSSDLPEILGMSNRIAVMRGGTIVRVLDGKTADAHSVMTAALGSNDKR